MGEVAVEPETTMSICEVRERPQQSVTIKGNTCEAVAYLSTTELKLVTCSANLSKILGNNVPNIKPLPVPCSLMNNGHHPIFTSGFWAMCATHAMKCS